MTTRAVPNSTSWEHRLAALIPPGRLMDQLGGISIVADMKRVTIAEAKQTLPALVRDAERRGD